MRIALSIIIATLITVPMYPQIRGTVVNIINEQDIAINQPYISLCSLIAFKVCLLYVSVFTYLIITGLTHLRTP